MMDSPNDGQTNWQTGNTQFAIHSQVVDEPVERPIAKTMKKQKNNKQWTVSASHNSQFKLQTITQQLVEIEKQINTQLTQGL